MKKNLTYIVFVVDRSGSMGTIAKDMIGGFNSFIKKQKEANLGDCKVSFHQFDTHYDTVYKNVNINDVIDLNEKTYTPRGGTALYPSLGKTIESVGKELAALTDDEKPERVLFVTITDGEHNSNLEGDAYPFTAAQVKQMIEHQTQVYNWDFVYIGANQDSWAVGSSMGNLKGTTLNYVASAAGTSTMFDSLNTNTLSYRSATTKKKFTFEEETTTKKS